MKLIFFHVKYIAVLVMCCFSISMELYGDDYYFESRNLSFLSVPSVSCITEDDNGRLWIGTSSGIIVYNGRNVENYNRSSLPALPADDIISLEYVDKSDEIWIGTVAGIVRYDLKDEKIRPVPIHSINERNIGSEFLRIESNSDGQVFAMTRDGLYVSEGMDRLKEVEVDVSMRGSIGYCDLNIGEDGRIWAVANDGLKVWNPEEEQYVHVLNIPAASSLAVHGDSVWIGTRDSASIGTEWIHKKLKNTELREPQRL